MFYVHIGSILATGHTVFLNAEPDAETGDICTADEWEFKVENMACENAAENEEIFEMVDHPMAEISDEVENKPTPKRKAQKALDKRKGKEAVKKGHAESRVFQ